VCTPAIAAISGQVSLVAVLANLAAAPAVGPTTVLGLIGGVVALVSTTVGHLVGHLAGLPASWIVLVATHGAQLAGASIAWPVGTLAITALAVLCVAQIAALQVVLRSRYASLAVAALLVLAVLRPLGRLGWPPPGWLFVACDVGQGDGLVLNAGFGAAVVVDTGPDPRLMDRCLDRLGVSDVPLVVLTHFHADHVDGLPGVLHGRRVNEIETSPLRDPPDRADAVAAEAAAASVDVSVAVPGEQRTIGQLHWSVLAPLHVPTAQPGDGSGDGSAPNNASVVMLVQVHGFRLLLSGDAEPEEEDDILATGVDLGVDVFKVAHHGSANQDPAFVDATSAPLAVISVGANNDYGHPAGQTLGLLAQLGAQVYRTDQDGDVAVVTRAGQLAVVTAK
jgi:competence protein ComEC